MLSTIYLLKYNNYYNRIVKKESTLSAYATHLIEQSPRANINFNPNDGVDTELVIGTWSAAVPDYMLVVENNVIVSRWFVIEAARTRAEQFKLTLRRDVIVDNYNAVIKSKCFVDKAKLNTSGNDIALYNKEPYQFNSIKQNETLLKDETGCPWIVGYLSQKDITGAGLTNQPIYFYQEPDYTLSALSEYWSKPIFTHITPISTQSNTLREYNRAEGVRLDIDTWARVTATSQAGIPIRYTMEFPFNYNPTITMTESSWNLYDTNTYTNNYKRYILEGSTKWDYSDSILNQNIITQLSSSIGTYTNTIKTNAANFFHINTSPQYIDNLFEENGKMIAVGNDRYIISVSSSRSATWTGRTIVKSDNIPNIKTAVTNLLNFTTTGYDGNTGGIDGDTGAEAVTLYQKGLETIEIRITQLSSDGATGIQYDIPAATSRNHLIDAPYDMFCIPFANVSMYENNVLKFTQAKEVSLSVATSMASNWSGVGFIYDLQILPYCPLPAEMIKYDSSGNFTGIDKLNYSVGTIHSTGSSTASGYIFFANQSQFQFSISNPISVTNIKQQHQTDNWRFNSPNWAASYDFDVTMNRGMSLINVDCNYKPYTPYIHLCPQFNASGLYGYNNYDATGLICSGDFSLPMVSDQWKTYEYQNKNYQNTFDRQIQNQKENYRLSNIEQGVSQISGIFTGAVGGAVLGGVGGAILGGLASAGGAIADRQISKAKQKEELSYASDMFNYQIDNVKSLPLTLSKVSAYNANNKLFPFIEYYSCTEQEKEIFNGLLEVNGMTINRADVIENFVIGDGTNFTKARLIKADDSIADDYHLVAAIANELDKGVYL